jgi:RNA polymerase sigma-70 factor (ECF subfamily)
MARQSVGELCRAHEAFLRRLAARLCGSTFEPDDLVQDVLERCMVHCGELPAIDNHRTWMARVMRNLFVDRLRRRAATPEPVPLEDHIATPVREARAWWETIDGDEILAQTRRLPEPLRAPFERFAFDGRTYQQIAQELGITKMTVGTRILRARRRLREIFSEMHDAPQRS